jgi:FkbM family methyltransferase
MHASEAPLPKRLSSLHAPRLGFRGSGTDVGAVVVQGLSMCGRARHRGYLWDLRAGCKEPLMARLFERSVRPGATVIDAGSYVGFYALVAARRAGPEGRVFAFEPNPEAYAALCENLSRNGLEEIVDAVPFGLGERTRRRRFYEAAGDGSESSLFPPRRSRRSIESACLSLDHALGERPIDVLKLDIEGGEVEALRGMRRTLAASPDVSVFVECNPRALRRAGSSARALLDELRRTGLDPRVIDERAGAVLVPGRGLTSMQGHVNLLCRRSRASGRRRSFLALDRHVVAPLQRQA